MPSFCEHNDNSNLNINKQNVKYPYYLAGTTGTTYGIPFNESVVEEFYNLATDKGFFVSGATIYSAQTMSAYTVSSNYVASMPTISGQTSLLLSANTCSATSGVPKVGDFLTIIFDGVGDCGSIRNSFPILTYKISASTVNSGIYTVGLDRALPIFSAKTSGGGSSRASVAALRKNLVDLVEKQSASNTAQLTSDLFSILTVLSSSSGLRRALTDNSRDANSKAELISNLFGKNISDDAKKLFAQAASLRWSNPAEIADAIENLAVESASAAADKSGELEGVENQLFEFAQLLIANPEFRQALNSATDSDENKVLLLKSVISGKYLAATSALLQQAVSLRRGRSIDSTISTYSHYVSSSRNRLVAHVKSAVELTDKQKTALVAALSKQMGKQVHINVEVDPKVLGGISIRYLDDVIDGTIINRLAEASRALAG